MAIEPEKAHRIRAILEEFQGPLLRYATHLLSDREEARDVVQETFLRLCAEELDPIQDHLAEWLFTVCRNRAFDQKRKETRMTPLEPLVLDRHGSDTPCPSTQIQTKEETRLVMGYLAALPRNQQEVVRLKFQNGLSYAEISRITQLSVSNVGFLLHTAMKTLREQMQVGLKPTWKEGVR